MLATANYFVYSAYNVEAKQFIFTAGGSYNSTENSVTLHYEFDSSDSTAVGRSLTLQIKYISADEMEVSDESGNKNVWKHQSKGAGDSPLAGHWRFHGRINEAGEVSTMQRGPRKTIKMLIGNRFHWAAINTETKQFFGCGGGTFTTVDGKYTENIEYFSRDGSRVGASLPFNFELKDGLWHHSGLSSKGDPIKEIWARD
jgi:hypothetical protein